MALTKATLIDLNANELILDLDADTSITADTDDTIHFKIGGSDEITMTSAGLSPAASDGNALGTAALEWADLFLADGAVISLGDDQDVTLTHVADTGVLLNSTNKIQFNDSTQFIHGSSATVLSLGATSEIDLTATAIDINGTCDVSGAFTTTTITASGIVKTDDTTEATSTTDGSLQTDGGLSVAKDAVFGDDVKLLSDAAVLGFGADGDVTLTHVADTGVLLNSTMAIQFNDASQYINAPSNAILDINATDEIELNATLVDINANVEISGTATTTGVHTFTAVPVLPANSIDSAHYVDGSIDNAHIADDQIDSEHYADGSIDLAHMSSQSVDEDNLYISNAGSNGQFLSKQSGNNGGLTWATASANTPSSADGQALGSASLEWSDLFLADSSTIQFGNDQDTILTHTDGTGLTLNSTNKLCFNDASQFVQGSSNAILSLGATDEIDLTATAIDINGTCDVSGAFTAGSTIVATGVVTGAGFTAGSAVIAESELELLDGLTAGTAIASKVVTTDGSIDTTGQRNLTITGELDAATLDISGAIDVAGNSVLASVDVTGVATAATFEPDGDTAANDNAAIGYTSAEGLILTGQGSTSDITLKNDADATVFTVPTGTDDILFPDNAKAMWGASSDLQIYHNGTQSFIKDTGTGQLGILTSNFSVLNAADSEYMIQGVEDGEVNLYYNGVKKLATTSDGLEVWGEIEINTGFAFTGESGSDRLTINVASGAVWIDGNCSAASFTDRTPYPETLQIAYDVINSHQRLPADEYKADDQSKQLDHSKLNEYVSFTTPATLWTENDNLPEGVSVGDVKKEEEKSRNMSGVISCLVEVVKDLSAKNEALTTRITALE